MFNNLMLALVQIRSIRDLLLGRTVLSIIISIPSIFMLIHPLIISINTQNQINIKVKLRNFYYFYLKQQQIYFYTINKIKMGNCNKSDQSLTVTNFDEQKWVMLPTVINQKCFILKNFYHSNVKLFKWIARRRRQNHIMKWRLQAKNQFLANIYESGETRRPFQNNQGVQDRLTQKRPYIVTEQLVRLKDLVLQEQQAVAISYKSLLAYQLLMRQLGGFIARQTMIYINREGVIKVWINENLGENQFQFPHPGIKQQQFISSILHQIFTRMPNSQSSRIYRYIKEGHINFSQVLAKLNFYINENQISTNICRPKEQFDQIIDSYEKKDHKLGKQRRINDNVKTEEEENNQGYSNRLKFKVADVDNNRINQYVRDYSQKSFAQSVVIQSKHLNYQKSISDSVISLNKHMKYSHHFDSKESKIANLENIQNLNPQLSSQFLYNTRQSQINSFEYIK